MPLDLRESETERGREGGRERERESLEESVDNVIVLGEGGQLSGKSAPTLLSGSCQLLDLKPKWR